MTRGENNIPNMHIEKLSLFLIKLYLLFRALKKKENPYGFPTLFYGIPADYFLADESSLV